MTEVADRVVDLVGRCQRLLGERGATVATAESLTGGLLGAALTSPAGSSTTYRGGVVAYAVELKVSLLGVPAEVLAEHGPVHAATAEAMASGVRERLGATYGLATTGVAGPDPHGDQPVGTVDVACSDGGAVVVRRRTLPGTRDEVRQSAVLLALELLRDVLERREGPAHDRL